MPTNTNSLEGLLIEGLKDLYDAEKQLVKALPKMAKAATAPQVRDAINEHLEVTKGQVNRLERVFEALGQKPKSKPCKGMKGLIEEGQDHISEDFSDELMNSVVIESGQKVEHYEMAAYTSAREIADVLGNTQVSRLLQQTVVEEERMAKKLSQISGRLLKETARAERTHAA
jgi:ferritin-like metal-binding protein YciE